MRANRTEMPVVMEGPGFESRQDTWGDMHVARESCEVSVDLADAFRRLPGGACPCPHWGYVIRGSISFRYPDGEVVARAGDAYYARPGHVPYAEAGSEIVEFSPASGYAQLTKLLAEASA